MTATITPLPPFQPDLYQRAWASIPHPTLPLLATPHATSVTIFSLATLSKHSSLTGGHDRSVRSAAWQPSLPAGKLRLVTGSFDSQAGVWTYNGSSNSNNTQLEKQISFNNTNTDEDDGDRDDWEFDLVLEGHENEVKSVAFSASGQFLATCSRDKSVWVWEDVGDDDWETVAVLSEHEGDVKMVVWGEDSKGGGEWLASASYDDTVRIWREDSDGEWVCVAVLEGHGGTVWGVQVIGGDRLLSHGADGTVRVWRREVGEDEGETRNNPWGGIPNTMRRELRESWVCEAVLPRVHEKDVYSVAWSKETGVVASTGSDGVVALYREEKEGDTEMGDKEATAPGPGGWKVLGTVEYAHGPYEVNHVTWCKRFDPGTERKGVEEMLVTTGDDGVVRPWQVRIE